MKKFLVVLAVAAGILSGCGGSADHAGHAHEAGEAHTHEGEEAHDHESHDHEDHNHEAGEAHEHTQAALRPETKQKESGAHADEIIVTPEQAEAFGLETQTIALGAFSQVIKVSGQILAAQGDETTQVAPVSGVVSFGKLSVVEGANVRKGQSVLSISSKNLSEGDPVLKARFAYENAKKEYERMAELVKDKIVTEKDFNAARLSYETAKVAYDAVAGQYTDKGQSVPAVLSGFVKSRLVNEGDYVQVGQPLFTLSQSNRLMLQAEVSARYYPVLPAIRTANFRTPYDNRVYCLDELNGKVLSYGKATSNTSFYLPVTFDFDNKGAIVPGSFVEVYLIAAPVEQVITVPLSALTEDEGLYFVYLRLDEEGYKKQEVLLGADNGVDVRILSGLKPGDEVVTKGAYQVKLASHSGAIPGHTHNH